MSDEGARIISASDARDIVREAAGRNVSCSFLIVIDPEMRPRKLIALLFVAREAAGRVLLDDFRSIIAMMPAGMRHSSRRQDDAPYILGYWTNADPGPTVH